MTQATLITPRVAVIAITLAATAALIGSGLAQLAAAHLFPLARAPALRLPRVEAQPTLSHLSGGLFREPAGDDLPEPPETRDCDPTWRLVGAAVFPDAPERSLAAVHTPSGGAVLGRSDRRDEWTLVSVAADRVTLEDADGRACEVAMHLEARAGGSGESHAPEPAPAASSRVEALGDHRYRVDRAALEQASIESPPRLVPGGGPDGSSLRVFGIRRGSLAHEAGIENGDVLTAVDGLPPTSERGLDAYARALRGEPVRVTVERQGQPLELRYQLAP